MGRGRKPKPTRLKILTGNPGKSKLDKLEPLPDVDIPPCPEDLSAAAKEEWNRITPRLKDLGLITHMDLSIITAYCQTWGDYMEAVYRVRTLGTILTSETGKKYKNPWITIKENSLRNLLRFASEFGLSPSARTKVKTVEHGDYDKEQMKRFFGEGA